jgi:hypothetical protein
MLTHQCVILVELTRLCALPSHLSKLSGERAAVYGWGTHQVFSRAFLLLLSCCASLAHYLALAIALTVNYGVLMLVYGVQARGGVPASLQQEASHTERA